MGKPRTIKGRAREVARRLAEEYPAECALVHSNPFELVVATILSAQCTDERVNLVTPEVFRRWPTPADLAKADPEELESVIFPTGFYRNKAKSLLGLGRTLEGDFGGEVPTAIEDLVKLPGVGRKTGNVVRSVVFDLPGLPVDTHVGRITRLLGLTGSEDPVKIEHELGALLPPKEWGDFSLRTILHGRKICVARRPKCADCLLNDICPSSQVPA
jgi:endonuclease-3